MQNFDSAAGRQDELLKLLLRDMDGRGGDVIWEADGQGCLRGTGSALEMALGFGAGELEGRELGEVLAQFPGEGALPHEAKALAVRLLEGKPIVDLPVPYWGTGVQRWWYLSAMPVSGEGWLGVLRDMTEHQCHLDEMERQAYVDSLTGLNTRFAIQKALQAWLLKERVGSVALMHLDINGFKAVNTAMGYPTGDLVLHEVGRRLKEFSSAQVLTARLGGDDFVVAARMDEAEALDFGRSLVACLQRPVVVHQKPIELRFSVGMSMFPSHCSDMASAFQTMGLALAAAKEDGADPVCLYEETYGEKLLRRLRTIQEIKVALDQEQFELWYQPQIDVSTLRTVGAEALLRWRHPQRGLVSPLEFIPLAEQSGLIVPLGFWVLERACLEASKWPEEWRVSVNVAPAQLRTPHFMSFVRRALERSGLSPRRLKLEITESALVDGNAQVRALLNEAHALGVCVSLDDFGTGYSSLSYLRQFPFDELKIDQSFVRAMMEDSQAQAIVETILQLARALRLYTTAEGVETPEQASVLKGIGCDYYQGYLYGKPVPHAQFLQERLGQLQSV